MKKIAFISPGYLPLPAVKGGAVETLIDILLDSNEINSNYSIDVYSIEEKNILNGNDNINYIYIKNTNKIEKIFRYIFNKYSNKYIGNGYINKIIKMDKIKNYDFVIVENKPEYGLILKPFCRGKLIFHSHNDFLNINTKNAKKIFNSFDEIYCLSKYICNRVSEIDKKNISKVKLLYNGIDNSKFDIMLADQKDERAKYGIKPDDIVFLYTGRLVKEKGIGELIKVFNKIDNDKYKLLIVGSIGYGKNSKDKFTYELKNLSVNNHNIIFTGFVPYTEIQKVYEIADYGIVPSIWEEPFALTVIEHLASGHPVIITNSGGMPELVNENVAKIIDKNHFELEMYNCIMSISKHQFFEKDQIKKYSRNFSKEKYINRFIELIEGRDNIDGKF